MRPNVAKSSRKTPRDSRTLNIQSLLEFGPFVPSSVLLFTVSLTVEPIRSPLSRLLGSALRIQGTHVTPLLLSMLLATAALSADRPPVTIELSDDYSKTFNIRLNRQFVRNEAVLQQLSGKITDPHTPVIVLMPGQVTFNSWDEIRGLLDKSGCLNVRYFVFSKQHRAMTELELPHEAIDYTLNPPPRNTHGNDSR